jgi:cold shock CspA family protein
LEINCLAVRPELVEGRAVDYDTVSEERGQQAARFFKSILTVETVEMSG